MSSEIVFRTESLKKVFRTGFWGRPFTALDDLNLEVRQGEAFGFLGPNGAGKSTTLRILVGLIHPTAGKAWIFGHEAGDIRIKNLVGFLSEAPHFYQYLTAEECLAIYGRLFGLRGKALATRIEEQLEMVGLSGASRLQLRKFSKGMLQRLGIAQALINDPRLVILDEPMSGLDPLGRKMVRDLILRLKTHGKTIFFSSHLVHDVEFLCDRVGILVKGRLAALGTVEELLGPSANQCIEVVVGGLDDEGVDYARKIAQTVVTYGHRALVVLESQEQVNRMLVVIQSRGATLLSLAPHKRSLEALLMRA
ncbi:ABC transporter ATP-binding protein [Nitrospira sp. Nam80]